MVRFSDIIKTDKRNIRKMQIDGVHPVKVSGKTGNKGAVDTDTQALVDLLPDHKGNENVRTYYMQLFEKAVDISDRVITNREISPAPVIAVLRRIIDENLIDELFKYAASIPDDFNPPSHLVSLTLAHLKMGKKMGFDTNNLLKSGFAALLHSADMRELPDRILQENVLSHDDIIAIRKHPGPTLDMLAHLVANNSYTAPTITEGVQKKTAGQLSRSHYTSVGIIPDKVKGERSSDIPFDADNTGLEQEATDKMEESDKAYKELAEITSGKKSGSSKLLPGLIVLAVIVAVTLWLSGILPFDGTKDKKQVALKEHEPVLKKKKISQPIKAPMPAPGPTIETAFPLPDKQPAPKGDKVTLPEEKPAKLMKEKAPAAISATPAPSPPHKELASRPDLPPVNNIRYPYSLHMASYKSLDLGKKSISALQKKGLSPYWTRVDLGAKGVWFRIFVGSFKNADEADEFQNSHGIKADRILKTSYAVQIGMYTSRKELDKKVSDLEETGLCPYYIIQPESRYQLLVGAFQTKKAAEKLAARLKESGLDCEMVLR